MRNDYRLDADEATVQALFILEPYSNRAPDDRDRSTAPLPRRVARRVPAWSADELSRADLSMPRLYGLQRSAWPNPPHHRRHPGADEVTT